MVRRSWMICGIALTGLLLIPSAAWADSAALILGGVPGSPVHETRFSEWVEATRTAMIETFGFDEKNVIVLQNREARAEDIRSTFADLGGRLTADDTFFLFFIGHGSFDGREYKFNTMGADLTAADYNELLSSIDAGRSVIVNATNSSGAAIEPFAAQGRVIVTATRTGTERNDTIFYDYFLEALADVASDEDKNERLSVWEVFRYATLAVERFYKEQNRLATEHPQISDNGREKTGVDPDEMPALGPVDPFQRRDRDRCGRPRIANIAGREEPARIRHRSPAFDFRHHAGRRIRRADGRAVDRTCLEKPGSPGAGSQHRGVGASAGGA